MKYVSYAYCSDLLVVTLVLKNISMFSHNVFSCADNLDGQQELAVIRPPTVSITGGFT